MRMWQTAQLALRWLVFSQLTKLWRDWATVEGSVEPKKMARR